MYYRKIEDNKRRIKLSKEGDGYRAGVYFDKEKGYWKKYHQYACVNKFERFANKTIRKYKGDIPNGRSYKKIAVQVSACW